MLSFDQNDWKEPHMLHAWPFYLHLAKFLVNVGKYPSPMEHLGTVDFVLPE